MSECVSEYFLTYRMELGVHCVYVYLIDLTKDMDIYKKIWQKFVFMSIMYAISYFIYSYSHT